MNPPAPPPGLVIRYAFLWSHERAAAKDRPCAIVAATRTGQNGAVTTIVAPISHRPRDERCGRGRPIVL